MESTFFKSTLRFNKMKFVFEEDCWWDGEFPMFYYVAHDFIPNGTPHTVEECYERVVEHLGLEDQITEKCENAIDLIERLGHDVVITSSESMSMQEYENTYEKP